MKEYVLKFIQLSKYAPTLVPYSRAEMNKFITGVSDLVLSKCRSTMLIPSMNISRIMIYAEQIKEQKLNQVNREVNKAMTNDENSSKGKFESQGRQRRGYPTKAPLELIK